MMKTLFVMLYKYLSVFCCCLFVGVIQADEINLDSLKKLLNGNLHDTSRCRIYYILAEKADEGEWQVFNQKMHDLAIKKHTESEVNQILKKTYASFIGSSYANFAYLAQFDGAYDKAIGFLNNGYDYFVKAGNKAGISSVYISLGAIYQRKNNLVKASEYYLKALELAVSIKQIPNQIEVLNNLGNVSRQRGDVFNAIEYFENSLRLAEKINDKDGIAGALFNLALIYSDFGNKKKAQDYVVRSLMLSKEINDIQGLAQNLNFMGANFHEVGLLDSALVYYNQSLKLRLEIGDKRAIAMSYLSIGRCYRDSKNPLEALQAYEKGLALNKEIGDKEGIAHALQYLGDVYLSQKSMAKAAKSIEEAYYLAEEIQYVPLRKESSRLMYNLYKINGNSAKALIFYEQYNQLSQKLASEDSKKAMLKSEYKLAYEKKEQELKLEQEKRDFIHQQEATQKQSDLQKQKLITYAFMLGFILLIALIYVVFRNLKQSKQANAIISEQKKEVEIKNVLIETKQTEILDSINYAKRIQYTLLAHDEFLSSYLKDYFIYYQPKDIVSGDFYWATFHKDRFYLAVCDSTGHGVPGAFMSLLNISFLNEAINEKGIEEPGPIFDHVRNRLMDNMSRDGQKDGFDGILACFEYKDGLKNFRYAAANNSPIVISKGQMQQLPGDRMPVGIGERKESFKTYSSEVSKGDMLYFYTDGYADQFGGHKGKKFMNRRLNELLNEIAHVSTVEQRKCLADTFFNWKGSVEQIDDVCVVGVRI